MEKLKVIDNGNQGFYSCCGVILRSIIQYYNENGVLPNIDSSQMWSLSKDNPEDISNIFFVEKDKSGVELETPLLLSYDVNNEDQFSDYTLFNFKSVNKLIELYYSPTDSILKLKDSLIERYGINVDNIISIYYRGTDKYIEVSLPSYESFMLKIDELKMKYPEKQLLLQTDEIEFYDFVMSKYPDTIVIKELTQLSKNSPISVAHIIERGKRVEFAKLFYSTSLIISKTSHIITNRGNVGMWITLFRGNSENVNVIR